MTSDFQEIGPKNWNEKRLLSLLSRFKKRKVLVLGDVGVDRYTFGSVDRISPEAPVPIVAVTEEKLKLGLAANVADNVQALGGQAVLAGVIGKDRNAEDFLKLCELAGIRKSSLVIDKKRRTSLKERIVSNQQQLLRVDYENTTPIQLNERALLLAVVKKALSTVDALIIEDYAKGLLTNELLREVIALANLKKIPVLTDPNAKSSLTLYRGSTCLTPNKREAEALSKIQIQDQASLRAAGEYILSETEAPLLIVTLGKEGMAVFEKGRKKIKIIPTFAREVYDVSGAGDTVISVLALALSSGAEIEEAVVLANLGAGVEVGKRGTATVCVAEIQEILRFVLKN